MIKSIVFDFGWVINKLGNLKISLDKIQYKSDLEYQKFIDFSGEAFIKSHLYEIDDLFEKIREFYNVDLTNEEICKLTIDPNVQVIELAKRLSKNYDLYIFTSIHKDLMNVFLQENPIGKYFKDIIQTCKEHLSKKDIHLYERLIYKTWYKAEEILFIDDGQKNLDLAKKVEIKTILFQSVEKLNKNLIKYGIKI